MPLMPLTFGAISFAAAFAVAFAVMRLCTHTETDELYAGMTYFFTAAVMLFVFTLVLFGFHASDGKDGAVEVTRCEVSSLDFSDKNMIRAVTSDGQEMSFPSRSTEVVIGQDEGLSSPMVTQERYYNPTLGCDVTDTVLHLPGDGGGVADA